jgi:hypothetical protein
MKIRFRGLTFRHIELGDSGRCPQCMKNTVIENWPPDNHPGVTDYHIELIILAGEGLMVGYEVSVNDLPETKDKILRRRWMCRCTECNFEWDDIHGN